MKRSTLWRLLLREAAARRAVRAEPVEALGAWQEGFCKLSLPFDRLRAKGWVAHGALKALR
jgi:hypothetical protein